MTGDVKTFEEVEKAEKSNLLTVGGETMRSDTMERRFRWTGWKGNRAGMRKKMIIEHVGVELLLNNVFCNFGEGWDDGDMGRKLDDSEGLPDLWMR